jgi:hypothetical protein
MRVPILLLIFALLLALAQTLPAPGAPIDGFDGLSP